MKSCGRRKFKHMDNMNVGIKRGSLLPVRSKEVSGKIVDTTTMSFHRSLHC